MVFIFNVIAASGDVLPQAASVDNICTSHTWPPASWRWAHEARAHVYEVHPVFKTP
jgi:hypothetical protein